MKVLAVYVFGIVDDAAINELTTDVSRVRAPPMFDNPEPRSEVNKEPPMFKLVVEAVTNEE